MNILHLTHCTEWFQDHFDFVCKQLGHTGETQQISDFGLTAAKADVLWAANADYYNSFDAVFVSHLATLSRIFLQNDWKKPLFIWLCFRFDHFDPANSVDREIYRKLIKQARLKPNVKFFAASEHDRLYTQRTLGDFPVEIVPPFVYVNNENKVKVPCENTFYLVNKHNELLPTLFEKTSLKEKLTALGIPIYAHTWTAGAPDLRGVQGVIHVPYTYLTRGLMENLALENVYFLPDLNYMKQLMVQRGFFWDVHNSNPGETRLSEWYREDNKNLFVFFSSLEHLKEISNSSHLKEWIEDRKQNIRAFNQRHNVEAREKWGNIFQ